MNDEYSFEDAFTDDGQEADAICKQARRRFIRRFPTIDREWLDTRLYHDDKRWVVEVYQSDPSRLYGIDTCTGTLARYKVTPLGKDGFSLSLLKITKRLKRKLTPKRVGADEEESE